MISKSNSERYHYTTTTGTEFTISTDGGMMTGQEWENWALENGWIAPPHRNVTQEQGLDNE